MEILRRNTDYALRIMVNLARHFNGELLSAKQLTNQGNFSYPLGCKILQSLAKARLVKSSMGPKGGFTLNRKPSENKCLKGGEGCEFQPDCQVSAKLSCLQLYIDGYLGNITLDEVITIQNKRKRKK